MYGYLLFLIVHYFNWIFINNEDLLVCFSKNLGLLLTCFHINGVHMSKDI